MLPKLFSSKIASIIILVYFLLFVWWIKINLSAHSDQNEANYFGAIYPILAIIGGVSGLITSKLYGSWSSVMGKGIIFLSLALLGQAAGQLIWAYYNIILAVEIPYPSIADVFYFAVIPFNILAMLFFAKASGVIFTLKKMSSMLTAIIIPLVLLGTGGYFFLRDYSLDMSDPVKVFLDFGYPLGEAAYISLAITTYLLSAKILGGVMKSKILIIIFAFILQFMTDYSFLYAVAQDGYTNGGFIDLMYTTSFAVYSLALLNMKYVVPQEKE